MQSFRLPSMKRRSGSFDISVSVCDGFDIKLKLMATTHNSTRLESFKTRNGREY